VVRDAGSYGTGTGDDDSSHRSSSLRSSSVSSRSGRRTSGPTGTPRFDSTIFAAAWNGKRSSAARTGPRGGAASIPHGCRDEFRKCRRERRHSADCASRKSLRQQRLRADEDVQPSIRYGAKRSHGLSTPSARGSSAPLRAAVATPRREPDSHSWRRTRRRRTASASRPARRRRSVKAAPLRRARSTAAPSRRRRRLRCLRREQRAGRCPRSTAHRSAPRRAAVRSRLHEELRRAETLLQRKEKASPVVRGRAGRPPTCGEEFHIRRDRVLVESLATVPERRQPRRQCSSQHGPTLS